MHFQLPRRYHSRLLLPPGLLALAGLLLVGCLALRPWQKQLKRRSVLQLTMPIRHRPDHNKLTIYNFVPDPDTLLKHYSWRKAHLTGNPRQNDWEQQRVISTLHKIVADTSHSGILSVQLGPKTRYSNMVFLLDLMLRENVKCYWLDITRHPTTFYALQQAYNPHQLILAFSCGTNDHLIRLQNPKQPTLSVRFDEWVTDFWQLQWLKQLWQPEWSQLLKQPEWRVPLALLALLFLQNIRRLFSRKHVARTL